MGTIDFTFRPTLGYPGESTVSFTTAVTDNTPTIRVSYSGGISGDAAYITHGTSAIFAGATVSVITFTQADCDLGYKDYDIPVALANGAYYAKARQGRRHSLGTTFYSNESPTASIVIAAVTLSAPANTAAPVVSGNTQEGSLLTCSPGTWTGEPTPALTYQWRRNGVAIGGATSLNYTSVSADIGTNVTCRETGTNSQGSATADSNAIAVVASPDWPDTADYTATSDATLAAHIATATTAGGNKIIDVAPGNYGILNISNKNPAAVITIRAQDTANPPVIEGVVYVASGRFTWRYINFICTRWGGQPRIISYSSGVVHRLSHYNCLFKGNYRNDPNYDLDPTKTYPEMQGIYGTLSNGVFSFTTTGPNGRDASYIGGISDAVGFTLSGDNDGAILPDGLNYQAYIVKNHDGNAGSGAVCVFDVVNGRISINQALCSGGSGYTGTAEDTTSVRLQLPANYTYNNLPTTSDTDAILIDSFAGSGCYAFQSSSATYEGDFICEDCTFDMVRNAIKTKMPSLASGGTTRIERCYYRRIYEDIHSWDNNSAGAGPVVIRGCFVTERTSTGGDMGNPHADMGQLGMNAGSHYDNITYEGNFHLTGFNRASSAQTLFWESRIVGRLYRYFRVCGNVLLGRGNVAWDMSRVKDGFIYRNIVALWDTTSVVGTCNMSVGSAEIEGYTYIGKCIAEGYTANDRLIKDDNITLTAASASDYASKFVAPASFPTTREAAIAAFASNLSFANYGPINSGYVDWSTGVVDRTMEPSHIIWTLDSTGAALTDKAISTVVTSEWSRLKGGPVSGRTVSISGGTYSVADDNAGTNATAFTGTSGTVAEGKYIQVRHTTSGSSSTGVTTTLTVNSQNFTFTTTTIAATPYIAADNQATAYSTRGATLSSETGIKKIVMACVFKFDTFATGKRVFSNFSTGGRFQLAATSSTAFSLYLGGSTPALFNGAFTFGTTTHTIISVWDGTLSTQAEGHRVWIDDTEIAATGGSFGAGPISMNLALGNFAFFNSNTANTLFDGKISMFYCDWGDATYAISATAPGAYFAVTANRAKFLSDNIGATGAGPTGAQPKLCYYRTDGVSQWNSGLVNRGSLTAPMTPVTGTYV